MAESSESETLLKECLAFHFRKIVGLLVPISNPEFGIDQRLVAHCFGQLNADQAFRFRLRFF